MRASVSAAPGFKPGQGVPNTSQHSAKFCFTLHAKFMQRSLPPPHSPLPGGPAHSAGPLKSCAVCRLWPPTLLIFAILDRLFADQKTHRKTTPFRDAQKSKKSDLGAFLAPILVAFWTPFGINFSIFQDSPKTFILQQVPSETLIFTSQTLSFWNKFSIKF